MIPCRSLPALHSGSPTLHLPPTLRLPLHSAPWVPLSSSTESISSIEWCPLNSSLLAVASSDMVCSVLAPGTRARYTAQYNERDAPVYVFPHVHVHSHTNVYVFCRVHIMSLPVPLFLCVQPHVPFMRSVASGHILGFLCGKR